LNSASELEKQRDVLVSSLDKIENDIENSLKRIDLLTDIDNVKSSIEK